MNSGIILLTPQQLSELVKEAVRAEVQHLVAKSASSENDEILSTDEVLSLLKISKSFLTKLRGNGLPHYWLDESVIRYKKREVLAFMQSRKKQSK